MAKISFQINSTKQRLVLILLVVFVIIWLLFVMKWSLANSMSTQSQYKEISQLAVDLSPNDPQPYYSLAALNEKTVTANSFADAVLNYEKAASLSPNNYLLWLSLGQAREQNSDFIGAEKAIRKALELAPNYSELHWVLGNMLLRNDKKDEAFVEIKKAAETNLKYINPSVSVAWQAFDGDIAKISSVFGDSDLVASSLAVLLAKKGNFDDALKVSQKAKTLNADDANNLLSTFLTAKKFRAASEINLRILSQEKSSLAKFNNQSFENDVKPIGAGTFEWQLTESAQPIIAVDDKQKQEGSRSLVMVFNSSDGKDFRQISQLVAVESSKKYRLQSFAKAELKASSTLKWEIVDANDGKLLGATNAVSANSDWQKFEVDFTTQTNTEAIIVRLARVSCGSTVCPISGKIWFDNFSLQ